MIPISWWFLHRVYVAGLKERNETCKLIYVTFEHYQYYSLCLFSVNFHCLLQHGLYFKLNVQSWSFTVKKSKLKLRGRLCDMRDRESNMYVAKATWSFSPTEKNTGWEIYLSISYGVWTWQRGKNTVNQGIKYVLEQMDTNWACVCVCLRDKLGKK